MCDFCKDDGEIHEINREEIDFGIIGNAQISLDMTVNNIFASFISIESDLIDVEVKHKINYCPMCGRNLKRDGV